MIDHWSVADEHASQGPRRNRVAPDGAIIATPARGTLLGNRGVLHNQAGEIARDWQHQSWITCRLSYKGRSHPLSSPGKYTALFFLDEAVALAAGHRPCGLCRSDALRRFRAAWNSANLSAGDAPLRSIDRILHAARTSRVRTPVALHTLPTGAFIESRTSKGLWLVDGGQLRRWKDGGYTERLDRNALSEALLVTPAPMLGVLRAGYRATLAG